MNRDEQMDENRTLFLAAGFVCLGSLAVACLAMRSVILLIHARWTAWLLPAVVTLIPLAMTFIILYCSAWHREFSKARRVVSMILSSCIIFSVDLLVMVVVVAAGCLMIGLGRAMEGIEAPIFGRSGTALVDGA